MRMGKANKKLRSRVKPPVGSDGGKLIPKYSSQGMVVGQVSSNVVASVLWPEIIDRATSSLERYADLMMEYDAEVHDIVSQARQEAEMKRLESVDEEENVMEEDLDNLDEQGNPKLNVSLPPPPGTTIHFQSQHQIDDLVDMVLQPHYEHFTKTSEWKVHVNAAKFERLLDERYGPFRPFVDRYPQIERTVRIMQRKYAKGEFSPLRTEEPPLNKSTSIVLLFMLQRNGVRWEAITLAAIFFLVGLQPWALVVLVSIGHRIMMGRKARRVVGMTKSKIVPTEPYYVKSKDEVGNKDLSEEEEKKRRNELLKTPVGIPIDATTDDVHLSVATQEEAQYDVLVLGSGPSALYTAALLSRAGKKVLVLSPEDDASGCSPIAAGTTNDTKWDGVPFDVQSNDISHALQQQRLLAPALCSTTDAQGGVRFAQIGSESDCFAHTILSIPGMGTDSHDESIPFVLHAGGIQSIAEEAAATLGDGWPGSDGSIGDSTSAQYLKFCTTVNATASKYYLTKLLPDEINNMRSSDSYQQSGIRYASGYLNKLLPLNGHVRALMAGMGMKDENIRPGMLSMAAHITNIGAMCSPEGMCYPVGGPRAICKAFESVIVHNGGRVLTGVGIKELIFEEDEGEDEDEAAGSSKKASKEEDEKKDDNEKPPPAPQCIGVTLGDGTTIKVREDGAVVSMIGFIPTFVHLLNPELRTKYGVPRGLPALSERRPLFKIILGLKGTADDLSITGADWYRLPNASRAFDESNPLTGEVQLGEIGLGRGSTGASGENDGGEDDPASTLDNVDGGDSSETAARRGKHSKKSTHRRTKFDAGVSWMKVSFPSAKDPSWHDRYNDISTCVITIEADDDFVTKFDSKPAIYSNHKVGSGDANRLMQRALKDLLENFPQLEGKIEFTKLVGPFRAGLSHNPERYAAKGIKPETLYPGLYVGGSDLTVGDSFSGSIVGGWLAANAVMGYNFVDYVFLEKHIVTDLEQFMTGVPRSSSDESAAVPFTPKPEVKAPPPTKDETEGDSATAEPSKEE